MPEPGAAPRCRKNLQWGAAYCRTAPSFSIHLPDIPWCSAAPRFAAGAFWVPRGTRILNRKSCGAAWHQDFRFARKFLGAARLQDLRPHASGNFTWLSWRPAT
ncbi:unnamed protein product [Amoebophrya sp. A120]|nr:unnamed protein product [Amoebophrya sp. A120]|eukprot:GSA120T00012112001.1